MKRKALFILLICFGLSACYQKSDSQNPGKTNMMDWAIAKARWDNFEASGESYRIKQIQSNAFFNTTIEAVVTNGDYSECTVTTIGFEPTPIVSECAPDSFPSVQAHFGIIKSAFEEKAHSIYVKYHSELGYALYIGIDQSLQMADEEFSLNVEITLL